MSKRHLYSHVFAAQFIIVKKRKQPKCPSTDEWIKKMWYIYTTQCNLVLERGEILSLEIPWMELEVIMGSEISQAYKDDYPMILLMCRI
jgi:hypothetical protein